jgi:hypothetical protein
MGLDERQRQVARALARRRFEAAAELDEAETLQPQGELAPEGGFDWPVVLMLGLVLIVAAGTGYVAAYG